MKELCKLFCEHFSYDRKTGKLHWRKPTSNRVKAGDEAGVIDVKYDGRKYRRVSIKGHKLYVHRVVIMIMHGDIDDTVLVDHRDGDGLNNRYENLRLSDASLNGINRNSLGKNNTSGIVGVTWWKTQGYWVARMKIRGELVHSSYHKKFEDAVAARKAAELEYANLR